MALATTKDGVVEIPETNLTPVTSQALPDVPLPAAAGPQSYGNITPNITPMNPQAAYANSGQPGVSAIQDMDTVRSTFEKAGYGITPPKDLPIQQQGIYAPPPAVAPEKINIPPEWSDAYTKAINAIGATTGGITLRSQVQALTGLLDSYQRMHQGIQTANAQNFQTGVTQRGQDVTAQGAIPAQHAQANLHNVQALYYPTSLGLEAQKNAVNYAAASMGKSLGIHDSLLKNVLNYVAEMDKALMPYFNVGTPEGAKSFEAARSQLWPVIFNQILDMSSAARNSGEGGMLTAPPAIQVPQMPGGQRGKKGPTRAEKERRIRELEGR